MDTQRIIDNLDSQIDALNAQIATIDGLTDITDETLQSCVDARKAHLESIIAGINAMKARYQPITLSEERQAVVDSIGTLFENKYDSYMQQLVRQTEEEQTAVFDMYALADTDELKDIVICQHFKIV